MIDDGGLLTMKTPHGSQSVLVPNLDMLDKNLRNTMFYRDKKGDRKVWDYGQIEISAHNRKKAVVLDNLRFVRHFNKGKDIVVSYKDFNKENPDMVKKNMNLGEVFDAIKGTDYEIAITSYRSPRTRPGDIIVSGLKGFMDGEVGNQARINAHDLKMRMEGDFDVDKVNYWWDTPETLFNKWDALQGEVGAVNPGKNPTSLKGLDFLKPGMIEKFAADQANAGYMRGQVVKMSRMLQFFDNYAEVSKGIVSREGDIAKLGDKKVIFRAGDETGRITLDPDKLKKAKIKLAEDIQTIVDSKNGYDTELFKDNVWQDKFLYGEKNSDYEGVFTWQTYDAKEKMWLDVPGEMSGNSHAVIAKTAINELLSPYRGLLQVGAGVFEGGKRRSTTYEDLIDASSRFETRMRFAHINARRKLEKQGIDKSVLDKIFMRNKQVHNPFGQIMPNITGELLPFERTIREIGRNDDMQISAPKKMFGDQLNQFNKWSEKYLELGEADHQDQIKNIIEQIGSDSKNYGYLNFLNWRIKKQNNTMWEARKNNNTNLAESIEYEVKRLTEKRDDLEKQLMTNPETMKMILNQAQRRISYEITSNWRYNKYTRNKKFNNYQEALDWVTNNQLEISKMAKKEPLRIKGINTSEQLDMIIWNEQLSKYKDIYIAPDFDKLQGKASFEFEGDLFTFKKNFGKLWSQLFDDKKRRDNKREPWLSENMIMEQAKGMFDEIYTKWESHQEGLGRLALLKLMAPTKDIGSMTYFNGKFVESFRSDSPTYIKFGLRWLSNTDKVSEMVKDSMFKSFADGYSSLYKTFRGIQAPAENFGHALYEETVRYNRENMYEAPVPLLDADLTMKWKTTDEYNDVLNKINPDIAATFGYNPQFTTGYLLSSRLVGPEWVKYAKQASAYSYSPTGFLPHDYSGGKLPTITGWDSFNNARHQEAKMFLGDALGKNILYAKFNPRVRALFEEYQGTGAETFENTRKVIENRKNDGC
jgi:hypothetical protein